MDRKYRVPKTAITEKGLKRLIRDQSKTATVSAWAEEHGILPQTVSAFLRKVQGAGLQIPEALGYRPQIVYLPLDEELITTPNPCRRPTKNPSKKTDHTRDPLEKRHLKGKNARKETRNRLKRRAK